MLLPINVIYWNEQEYLCSRCPCCFADGVMLTPLAPFSFVAREDVTPLPHSLTELTTGLYAFPWQVPTLTGVSVYSHVSAIRRAQMFSFPLMDWENRHRDAQTDRPVWCCVCPCVYYIAALQYPTAGHRLCNEKSSLPFVWCCSYLCFQSQIWCISPCCQKERREDSLRALKWGFEACKTFHLWSAVRLGGFSSLWVSFSLPPSVPL